MTTAISDEWLIGTRPNTEPRGTSLDNAYVISGAFSRTSECYAATLDSPEQRYLSVALGAGAVAATVAFHRVFDFFSEVGPAREIVLGSWIRVVTEIDVADDIGLTTSVARLALRPMFSTKRADTGSTYSTAFSKSLALLRTWRERLVAPAEDATRYSWFRVRRLLIEEAPSTSPPRDSKANAAWLRKNSQQYAGAWIALRDGSLLGAEGSRAELVRKLREANQLTGAFVVSLKT